MARDRTASYHTGPAPSARERAPARLADDPGGRMPLDIVTRATAPAAGGVLPARGAVARAA